MMKTLPTMFFFLLAACSAPVELEMEDTTEEKVGQSSIYEEESAEVQEPAHTETPNLVPDAWPSHLPNPEHALDAWPADMLTDRCKQEAGQIKLTVGSEIETEEQCGDIVEKYGFQIYGCYKSHPARIVVRIDVPMTPELIAAHELAHWLYACSGLGASGDNHGEELFETTIEGTLDVWKAEIADRDPEMAPEGTCPSTTTCDTDAVCVDQAGYPVVTAEGDTCEPFVLNGRSWTPQAVDGQCVVTCGGEL